MIPEKFSTNCWQSTMNSKIFTLTYAGGSSDFYTGLKDILFAKGVTLIPLEYAGHGTRRKELLYSDFSELAEDITKQILQNISEGEAYSIMGYSMGTIATVEVLKQLSNMKAPMPQKVILAAHEPKEKCELSDWNEDVSEEFIKERVLRFGGVSPELIENRVFWRVYLPIFENDFRMIEEYDFTQIGLRTDIPALVLYSETDTPFSEIENWNKYFVGPNEFREYSGNHFFINDHMEAISERIAQWVKEDNR